MSTIKADPAELRRLAHDLRHSAAHLRQLGDQAVGAAASAGSPAAAGTMAEAASFAAGAHVTELETRSLASGTERIAGLFESADRGGGWFSAAVLFRAGLAGREVFKAVRGAFKNAPHSASPKAWRRFAAELRRGRGPRAGYWGFGDAGKAITSWGHARWQTLTHPKSSLIKFKNQGLQAMAKMGKPTALLRRVTPAVKFGDKLLGKVLKPFNIVQSYRDSKAGSPLGKATSVLFSTVLTKNPIVLGADLVTGEQLSKGVDGIVSTIAAVGDSDRLSEMSQANAKGENGWAMQGIQYAGDGLAEGIWNGWSWLSNGH